MKKKNTARLNPDRHSLLPHIKRANYQSFIFNQYYNVLFLRWKRDSTMVEINYWTNGKMCAKVAFPTYTESVKVRSQSRETASKRKPYRGLGTR